MTLVSVQCSQADKLPSPFAKWAKLSILGYFGVQGRVIVARLFVHVGIRQMSDALSAFESDGGARALSKRTWGI